MNILIMILLIGVLIIVHEFGHFLAAKAFNVQVSRFGIGLPFGPTLYRKQFGETEFLIHAFLFGGYVSFPDDEDEEEVKEENKKEQLPLDSPRRLKNKNDIQKAIIFIAGVLFNYITAFIIILFCAFIFKSIPANTYKEVGIASIMKDNASNIEQLGAKAGDIFAEINGVKIDSYYILKDTLKKSNACKVTEENADCKTMDVTLLRDNKPIHLSGVKLNSDGLFGVQISLKGEVEHETKTIPDAIKYSLEYTKDVTLLTLNGIGQLFSGGVPLKDWHGIVAITKIGGDVIENSGLKMGLLLTAVISINLALFNLLPIPALDGGHLLFLIINRLSFGKISEKVFEKITVVFFILLIILLVGITVNDIYALITNKF